ncbi:AcrB/AcrD/AcrF family protein, partial [Vibrio sp. 10N.222.54.F6]
SYIEGIPTNHVLLKPWGERDQSADELVNEFIAKAQSSVSAYGMSFKVRSADNLNIATNMILQLTTVNRDTTVLSETASEVVKALEDYEGVTNIKNSMLRDQLRYDLS